LRQPGFSLQAKGENESCPITKKFPPHLKFKSEFLRVTIQPMVREKTIVTSSTYAQWLTVNLEYNLELSQS